MSWLPLYKRLRKEYRKKDFNQKKADYLTGTDEKEVNFLVEKEKKEIKSRFCKK